MANRRMLSKSISHSRQVNYLSSDFVKLVFTWGIPHLDDFGKIDGEADVFKAIVLPMSNVSVDEIETAIRELVETKLVERYEINGKSIIHYTNFEKYQTGLNKRTKSRFPNQDGSFEDTDTFSEIPRNSLATEEKVTKEELKTAKETEVIEGKPDKSDTLKRDNQPPSSFVPQNRHEYAAFYAWKALEPDNKEALFNTYLNAVRKGIKAEIIYQFVSEIKQDRTIKSPGKVFNAKVKSYIIKEDDKS